MKKNQLFRMLILFIFITFSFFNCVDSNCIKQDVKVGEVLLMSESKTFMTNFVNKTAIFKDSIGTEMKFKNVEKIKIDTNKSTTRINCNKGLWPIDKSYDFIEWQSYKLTMVNDSLVIYYLMSVLDLNFDALDAQVNNNDGDCGGNSGWVIYKDRGKKDVTPLVEKARLISDTLINGKSFKNILGRWRKDDNICCCGYKPALKTPYEVFFDKQKGIVGFKQLNGKTWTLDRIE